ncbi:MAG TPA: hypothetical protein VFH56_10380, partial [Acidimicrobiales bacterium]|nr:hypothetical protein [Acidimicrobiales bacterium]
GRRAAALAALGLVGSAVVAPEQADAATAVTDRAVARWVTKAGSRTHRGIVAIVHHTVPGLAAELVTEPHTMLRHALDRLYPHAHGARLTGRATLNDEPIVTEPTAQGIALVQALIHGR